MTTAYIAFGGNLGPVRETFIRARSDLAATDGISVVQSSKLYRTPPLGPPGQPNYLNAVVTIETSLDESELLTLLQQTELLHGRERKERWGPRTLDLDIIAYGEKTLQSERLTLPHPHMHERMFVLCPLCDVAPTWQHPLLKATAEELMQKLLAEDEVQLPEGEPW